jgi:glycosyltransferase involved in cell wall biosynthesis
MVKDEVTGFLASAGNPDHLRLRIQMLIDSPQIRINMGRAARRNFEENFQIDVSVRKTVAVYDAAHAGGQIPIPVVEL